VVRIVQHLTSSDLPRLREVLMAVPPDGPVTIDLRDCELVAGLAWDSLWAFDVAHPETRWLAAGKVAAILAQRVAPTRIEG
jgi:hypothetical protein